MKTFIASTITLLLVIGGFPTMGCHAEPGLIDQNAIALLRPLRLAGQQKDWSKVPFMISLVKTTTYSPLLIVVLHSLAQMGATDALPAIETVIQESKNGDNRNYAQVEKARLMAEAAHNQEPQSKSQAQAKLTMFLRLLPISSQQINSVVTVYSQRNRLLDTGGIFVTPLEVYAMREAADIIYHDHIVDYARLPGISELDFALDYPSALKVQLAVRSEAAQVEWLIQDLSQKKALTGENEDCEIQLAKEKGLAASPAAAQKLKEMEQNGDSLLSAGFDAVLGVLVGTHDPQYTPLWEHFKAHPDSRVRERARQGGGGSMVYGY